MAKIVLIGVAADYIQPVLRYIQDDEAHLMRFWFQGPDGKLDMEGPLSWSLGMRYMLKPAIAELTIEQFASLLKHFECDQEGFLARWNLRIFCWFEVGDRVMPAQAETLAEWKFEREQASPDRRFKLPLVIKSVRTIPNPERMPKEAEHPQLVTFDFAGVDKEVSGHLLSPAE